MDLQAAANQRIVMLGEQPSLQCSTSTTDAGVGTLTFARVMGSTIGESLDVEEVEDDDDDDDGGHCCKSEFGTPEDRSSHGSLRSVSDSESSL